MPLPGPGRVSLLAEDAIGGFPGPPLVEPVPAVRRDRLQRAGEEDLLGRRDLGRRLRPRRRAEAGGIAVEEAEADPDLARLAAPGVEGGGALRLAPAVVERGADAREDVDAGHP